MKMVKSLVLGSTAALFAVGGAQAADLPVKAKTVEYVRICSLYGAGFFYIPGTDTCIKIGAFVKLQTAYNANMAGPFMMGVAANGTGDNSGRHDRVDRPETLRETPVLGGPPGSRRPRGARRLARSALLPMAVTLAPQPPGRQAPCTQHQGHRSHEHRLQGEEPPPRPDLRLAGAIPARR